MTKTQMLIDEMHKGNAEVIIENISSSTSILTLNAIMAGTKFGLRSPTFLDGVVLAEESDVVLLGVPLKSVAAASLHLLGKKEYTGNDPSVISLINSKFAT